MHLDQVKSILFIKNSSCTYMQIKMSCFTTFTNVLHVDLQNVLYKFLFRSFPILSYCLILLFKLHYFANVSHHCNFSYKWQLHWRVLQMCWVQADGVWGNFISCKMYNVREALLQQRAVKPQVTANRPHTTSKRQDQCQVPCTFQVLIYTNIHTPSFYELFWIICHPLPCFPIICSHLYAW